MSNDSTHGFGVARTKMEMPIGAPQQRVWQALTQELEQWWPKSFCMNPNRVTSFRMEFKLGGRMYEDWGNGDGWLWWTIFKIDSQEMTFSAWGYESDASIHKMQFAVRADGNKSVLIVGDEAFGSLDAQQTSASHAAGWKELFEGAFRPYVEKINR